MAGKRRAVIILHPDFDQDGANGIKEAKDFAEQLIKGQDQIIEIARQSGEPPEVIEQVKAHTAKYKIIVRKIPEDLV